MKNKYYADAYGVDMNALVACIHKGFELANSDDEIKRVVIYSHTKNNFMQISQIFGTEKVNQMFSQQLKFKGCYKPIICATEITYKKECEYKDTPKDVVICCHMDSKAVCKVDDYLTAKYIIALSWTLDGLKDWKLRWNAQNVLGKNDNKEQIKMVNPILEIALREMDNRMFNSKNFGHPDDEEVCKTYIRAIHKYLPEITPIDVENFLVSELGWENKNSTEVGKLLQRLKDGKTFRGGKKTFLREYYNEWKMQIKK